MERSPDGTLLRAPIAPPGTPQLTVRAIVTGMLLGGIMSLSNLYVALKIGWSFGVTITAGILAFTFWTVLARVGITRRDFGVLENNAMQSVASAAGYMTGGGTVAAIPALMMLTGEPMPWTTMLPWVALIAALGVFVAIPMKRQMIDIEQLRFPSGIAAAETLASLHGGGSGAAGARSLGIAGIVGAVVACLKDAPAWFHLPKLPPKFLLPGSLGGRPIGDWTWSLDPSVLLLGAGGLMGMRVAWSQLLGALVNFGFLAPWAFARGDIAEVSYKKIVAWSVWFGSALLLTSGLLSFALTWATVKRALTSVGTALQGAAQATDDQEVPFSWFLRGLAVLGPLVILAQWAFFGIAPWLGAVAVVMSLFIAIVACRSTGETDTTPTGALGKITQLTFGALDPGNVTTNLMTANVGGGVALHSADLLTDLKSGWLLGANPRQQFVAQFFGVAAGSLFVVPAYLVLVPDASVLGTDAMPAPGALSWKAVAELLAKGVTTLPASARWSILIGAIVGILLVLAERAFPKRKVWIPSAMGVGLAFTMPAYNTVSMFLGATLAWIWQKAHKPSCDGHLVSVSSGLIAGESLMGVLFAFFAVLGLG
jgi:OPT family oligopeptide transporter